MSTPNVYLLILAALGWCLSIYFGFFRYRQFVWSRNKVRYDLLLKVDQQRAGVGKRLNVISKLGKGKGSKRQVRKRALLLRYEEILQHMLFLRAEGAVDEAVFLHWRNQVREETNRWTPDLTEALRLLPSLEKILQ